MNRILTSGLLLYCLTIFTSPIEAANFPGSELSYSYVSPGVYKVRLTTYRDCATIQICPTGPCNATCSRSLSVIGVESGCIVTSLNVNLVSVSDVKFGLCSKPEYNSNCSNRGCKTPGPYSIGFEKYVFEGNLTLGSLGSSCCNFVISNTECCKSSSLNSGQADESYYTQMTLNRCLVQQNSSPVLTNDPRLQICGSQPFLYNCGALDPDGDSLSYAFVSSLKAAGTSSNYSFPYSPQAPMPWTGSVGGLFPNGISCNPINGDIMFKPAIAPFVGLPSIEIKEWRKINGTYALLGTYQRTLEMRVVSCEANNPVVLKTDSFLTARTSYEVNSGSQLCFSVIASDPDSADQTNLRWNASLEALGATFTPNFLPINPPRESRYKFCWVPQDSLARSLPYMFTISGDDGRCPMIGEVTRAFSIKVFPVKAKSGIVKTGLSCYKWQLGFSHPDLTQTFSGVKWKVAKEPGDFTFSNGFDLYKNPNQMPIIRLNNTGKYFIQLEIIMDAANGSTTSTFFNDTITSDTIGFVEAPADTFICNPGGVPVLFTASFKPNNYKINWFVAPDRTFPFAMTPSLEITPKPGPNTYIVKVFDSGDCAFYDSVFVMVGTLSAAFTIPADSICQADSVPFTNQFNYPFKSISYLWRMGDGFIYNGAKLMHKYATPGNYPVTYIVNNANACVDSVKKNLFILPKPQASFSLSKDSNCLGAGVAFINQTQNTTSLVKYKWDTGDSNIYEQTSLTHTYSSSGIYRISLKASASPSCSDSFIRNAVILSKPPVSFSADKDSLCQGKQFSFTNKSVAATYTWFMGDGKIYTTTNSTHQYSATGQYKVTLKAVSDNGCMDSISKVVAVLKKPTALYTYDHDTICSGGSISFTNQSIVSSSVYKSLWVFDDGVTDTGRSVSRQFKIFGSYDVYLKVTDSYECTDTVMHSFRVNPTPEKPVISGDSIVKKHTVRTYSVISHSGSTWAWFISGDSIHKQISSGVIVTWGSFSSVALVRVTELSANSCLSDTASKSIQVKGDSLLGLPDLTHPFSDVVLYPNPADRLVNIIPGRNKIDRIQLYNMQGALVKNFGQDEVTRKELNVAEIPPGFYQLRLIDNNLNGGMQKLHIER